MEPALSIEQRVQGLSRGCREEKQLPPVKGQPHSITMPVSPLCCLTPALTLHSPGTVPLPATIQLSIAWKKGLFNTESGFRAPCQRWGVPGKMLTAVTQPSLYHQAAAIINERIKRSTQGAEKVDNDLCLPKGKII